MHFCVSKTHRRRQTTYDANNSKVTQMSCGSQTDVLQLQDPIFWERMATTVKISKYTFKHMLQENP